MKNQPSNEGMTLHNKQRELDRAIGELEEESLTTRILPKITPKRVLKDALSSLIPGSSGYNILQTIRAVNKFEGVVERSYEKIHPGVPTAKEHPLENILEKGTELVFGPLAFYFIENSLIDNVLKLFENPVKVAFAIAGWYSVKTLFNFGLRYAREHASSTVRLYKNLEKTYLDNESLLA